MRVFTPSSLYTGRESSRRPPVSLLFCQTPHFVIHVGRLSSPLSAAAEAENIPAPHVPNWSAVRIYPRVLRPIGPGERGGRADGGGGVGGPRGGGGVPAGAHRPQGGGGGGGGGAQ
eukprot:7039275-Pyramimonas_sp.AAC.1